jgi:hypothetical protein
MVTAAIDAKKRYDAASAFLSATTLLEEEERIAAVLVKEARVAAILIETPSPTSPLAPTGGAAPSDDDYEAAIIASIHVQAAGV